MQKNRVFRLLPLSRAKETGRLDYLRQGFLDDIHGHVDRAHRIHAIIGVDGYFFYQDAAPAGGVHRCLNAA
jgi:hypothetical protein